MFYFDNLLHCQCIGDYKEHFGFAEVFISLVAYNTHNTYTKIILCFATLVINLVSGGCMLLFHCQLYKIIYSTYNK